MSARIPAVPGGDDGFTMIELMVSLFIVALVGTFAAALQMASSRAVRTQADRQIAAQLVTRELEKARGMGGDAAAGLDPSESQQINGLTFQLTRTVDPCWQTLSADGKTLTCTGTQVSGSQEMAHVVIVVSWAEGDKTATQSGDVTLNPDPVFPT